ncbi:MAG TPA: class F sortase [Dehalococcoidia bacterium]|nr:class F sortase [Dehalococcoidia bacterium]
MLILSLLLLATGVALIAAFAIESFSAMDSAPDAPAVRHLSVEPDPIYDRVISEATRAPTPKPTPKPTPTPAAVAEAPPLRGQNFGIQIPRIGVDAPVNTYGLDANLIPQVPLNGYEVAWYNWSAEPGTGSNAVLAGHVTWSGAGVFYNLEQLSAGDEILLRGADGTELKYVVEDNFLVDPHDAGALSVMGPTETDTITVITCGGTFYSAPGNPFGGDYTNRRVVRARFAGVSVAADSAVAAGSES